MGGWGLFQFVTCHILTHKKQKDAKIRIWNQKKVRNLRKDVYHQNAWKLSEKVAKLHEAEDELESLRDEYNSQTDLLNNIINYDKQIAGYFHQHVSIILKAAILDQVLHDATLICRKLPEAAEMAENTFIDDYNFLRWKDVFTTGLRVFMNGIDGATSVAQTSGGGGTSSDMPWRDKDEDYLHWAYRAMRYAHAKHYPGNRFKRSLSK